MTAKERVLHMGVFKEPSISASIALYQQGLSRLGVMKQRAEASGDHARAYKIGLRMEGQIKLIKSLHHTGRMFRDIMRKETP